MKEKVYTNISYLHKIEITVMSQNNTFNLTKQGQYMVSTCKECTHITLAVYIAIFILLTFLINQNFIDV